MRKKYLAVTLLLILISSISVELIASAGANTILSLTPTTIPTQNLSIGSTFDIKVHVSDIQQLWQWWFLLSWNPAVLTVSGNVVEGPFLKSAGSTLFIPSAKANLNSGILSETSSTLMSLTSASGNGDLAIITFKVVGYGSTTINFDSAGLNGVPPDISSPSPSISFTSMGCYFNLPNPNQPTPSPSPTPTSSPSPTPTSSPSPTPTSSPSPTPTSSPSPTPTPTSSPSPTPTPTPTSSPSPTPSTSTPPQTNSYNPTANFFPENNTSYAVNDLIILDASKSTPGFDTAGKIELCPVTSYAWRVEYLNNTELFTLSGKTVSFTAPKETDLRIILIVIALDPTLPSSASYNNAASKTAIIHIYNLGAGGRLDVYLDKGGLGQKMSSSPYSPQELANLYALVTYRDAPVMNKDVIFTIYDANNSMVAIRGGRTNATGIAEAEFRFPWPNTNNPESVFGNWSIFATVDLAEIMLNDTVSFTYNYLITTKSVQVPITIHRLDNPTINLTLNSINTLPIISTVTLTVYDSASIPIAQYVISNVTVNLGNNLVTKTIAIPSSAFFGQATIFVNILTNAVESGGLPLCREFTKTFQIQP